MRLLVTGRHGQLARSLAERGVGREGIELHFVGRPEADLEQPGAIAAAIADLRPDVVVNAAAYTDVDRAEEEPERAFRINAGAAGEASEVAAAVGAAIVQLSTDYVFDGQASAPYSEDDPTGPINIYGASKLAGEERVRAADARHLILRTSWLVGPFGRNFVRTMLRLAGERDEIAVVADQVGSPTGSIELADAILALVERWRGPALERADLGQTFHYAGAGQCSWAELALRVMSASAAAGGPSARIRPIASTDFAAKVRRPAYSALDCGKFERHFSVAPAPWQDMVDRLVRRIVAEEGR